VGTEAEEKWERGGRCGPLSSILSLDGGKALAPGGEVFHYFFGRERLWSGLQRWEKKRPGTIFSSAELGLLREALGRAGPEKGKTIARGGGGSKAFCRRERKIIALRRKKNPSVRGGQWDRDEGEKKERRKISESFAALIGPIFGNRRGEEVEERASRRHVGRRE